MDGRSVRETSARRRRGSALLVSVMLLLLMGQIGLASFDTVTRDRQTAGFQTRARAAMYAAEAGVSTALGVMDAQTLPNSRAALEVLTPPLPAQNLGDATLYPYGRPSFAADPVAANPISYLGSGGPCPGFNPGPIGGPVWLDSLWDVRVQGQTAEGVSATVQATALRCHLFVP